MIPVFHCLYYAQRQKWLSLQSLWYTRGARLYPFYVTEGGCRNCLIYLLPPPCLDKVYGAEQPTGPHPLYFVEHPFKVQMCYISWKSLFLLYSVSLWPELKSVSSAFKKMWHLHICKPKNEIEQMKLQHFSHFMVIVKPHFWPTGDQCSVSKPEFSVTHPFM